MGFIRLRKDDGFVDDLKRFKRKNLLWSISGILTAILIFMGVYFIFVTCLDHSYRYRIDFDGRPKCFSIWCDSYEIKLDDKIVICYNSDGSVIGSEDIVKIDRIAYLEKED